MRITAECKLINVNKKISKGKVPYLQISGVNKIGNEFFSTYSLNQDLVQKQLKKNYRFIFNYNFSTKDFRIVEIQEL
ncbi:MAG: hypothetical protein GX299_10925 [Epulopiscium sp.]|jgi:hypothetical protein|nr:hypothetical protein [Candidatus Epulonipiscium sp.]